MERYMVIAQDEAGEVHVNFFGDLHDAEYFRQNAECGMGWYAEVYERTPYDGYRLVYA